MSKLKERVTGLSPDRRALLEERLLQAHRPRRGPASIPRRPASEPALLSFGQEQMWFLDQLDPGTATYNIPDVMRITGPLNVEALEAGLRAIVSRHEVLRTRVGSVAGSAIPAINENWEFNIRQFDLRETPEATREIEARQIIQEQAREPFNIAQDLTLRAALIRLANEQYYLLVLTHHIAWDVSSRIVLYKELSAAYKATLSSPAAKLPDLRIQYSDFAAWQRKQLQGEIFQGHAAYWREQLGSAAHVLELPSDRPRKSSLTSRGAKHFFSLSPALVDQAKVLSREQNATLFMTLLAGFVAYLYAFTGQGDVSIGSPMAGRNVPELEDLIGFFINTTVLRFEVSPETTFRQLVEQSRKVTLGAHAHMLPLEKLVEIVRPKRDPSRMALVQVNFRVQSGEAPKLDLPGVQTESMLEFIDTGTAKFDLALELAPDGSNDSFFEYNSALFEASTITGVIGDFERALSAVLQQPEVPLGSVSALGQLRRRNRPMENVADKPKMRNLKDFKRKAVDLAQPAVNTTQLQPDQKLPLIVTPAVANFDLAEWAGNNRDFISEKVLEHGAVLFRGFNLPTPSDFERAAAAICKELFSEYGDLPREGVAGKIYKSTPYPADKMILYHNESSHLSSWPTRINFYCALPAQQGGATPVADCREVVKAMDPEVLRTFEEKGLKYVRNFSPGLDVSWQQFFHSNDRSVVEKQCHAAGMTCDWTANDGLRVAQNCKAVTRHPKTGEKIFFNQVQLHHVYCLDKETRESLLAIFKREELPRHVYYGDGTEIPDSVMEHVGEVYEKCAVRFQWQKGDLISVDNMMVCHARDPHVGDRKICVAMGPLISAKDAAAQAAALKN
jgi:alpha-ketoglutarate-dependent taurine dioxygenase